MNDFAHMLTVQKSYVNACSFWKRVMDDLSAMKSCNPSLPDLLVDRGNQRVLYAFADVLVYCHFTYAHPHGVLLFGYCQKDAQGVAIDTLTSMAFFDQKGYVKTSVDEAQSGLHITSGISMPDFMFARFRDALDKRFKDVLATTEAGD